MSKSQELRGSRYHLVLQGLTTLARFAHAREPESVERLRVFVQVRVEVYGLRCYGHVCALWNKSPVGEGVVLEGFALQ